MSRETKSVTPSLVRGFGQLDAPMVVVGILIGSGIFIVSAECARLVGSPGWLMAVWALAGLMTITGSQCAAELAPMMPCAGGQYVFLRESYGAGVAFLFGWALFLIIQTGKIAAPAIAFASFTAFDRVGVTNQFPRATDPLRTLRGQPIDTATFSHSLDRCADSAQYRAG